MRVLAVVESAPVEGRLPVSLLFKVLFVGACKNTHHKLVLDSLRFLRGNHSENWRNLFIKHYILLLSGAKAPDDQFKDFKNHVLHVNQNYWGGAVTAAKNWYRQLVDHLGNQQWLEATYAAGVLSHYVSDPYMPLHTDQTETEGKIHRACEWSVACSYSELQQIVETDLGGYPAVELTDDDDWLGQLVRDGATSAHEHYSVILDHYNLAAGVKDPPAGLDQELKDRIGLQIARAVVSVSRVFDRAFEESGTSPPDTYVTLEGILASMQLPVHYVTKKLNDLKERAVVEAIYDEVQRTGKVLATLPEDEKMVRQLHAKEVVKKPLSELDAEKPGITGKMHGQGAPMRWRLSLPVVNESGQTSIMPKLLNFRRKKYLAEEAAAEAANAAAPPPPPTAPRSDLSPKTILPPLKDMTSRVDAPAASVPPPPKHVEREKESEENVDGQVGRFHLARERAVVDAPSIGPKMARRLEQIGIHTVNDLFEMNADTVAKKLNLSHVDARTVREWQAQSSLMCRVPGLRGHDAQLLVAAGITEAEQLVELRGRDLLEKVIAVCDSSAGERILRGGKRPDIKEVMDWIRASRQARSLQEA